MSFLRAFEAKAEEMEKKAESASRDRAIKTIEDLLREAEKGVKNLGVTEEKKSDFTTKLGEFKTAVEAWKQMESGQGFEDEYYRLNEQLVLFNNEINPDPKQQSEKKS